MVGKPSYERECSKKLNLRSYLEMLWSETGYFGLLGKQSYIVYYPIISYQSIKVYRVETMGMGISHWKNGVIGTFLISISTTVLIVLYKIPW